MRVNPLNRAAVSIFDRIRKPPSYFESRSCFDTRSSRQVRSQFETASFQPRRPNFETRSSHSQMRAKPRVADSRSELYSLKPQNLVKVGIAQKRVEAKELL